MVTRHKILVARKKNSKIKQIVVVCIDLFAIFFFRLLVEYTEDRSDWFGEWKEWKGYVYAGSMFVAAAIQSLALHQYFQIMTTIGMRVRTAVIGLVYEKVQKKNRRLPSLLIDPIRIYCWVSSHCNFTRSEH